MHQLLFDFITGMSIGIEFINEDDLYEGDKFAMIIDLLILRITYIYSDDTEPDALA